MRPPELNVRFVLYELDCRKTEDRGGDEPYLWVLGFKVDAETLGPPLPPPANPLIPSLGVHIFEGPPHSRFITGGNTLVAPKKLPIPPAMGTREFRLKPAKLPVAGWFPGIAGIICLLWDNDAFTADTRDDTYKTFRDEFGPALSDELNKLMNGNYDETLRRDANNQVVPGLEAMGIPQRLERLGNTEVRKRVVKAMKDALVSRIRGKIEDVVVFSIDSDDLLGAEVEVYLGNELTGAKDFLLRYTDDEADYTVRGQAFGQGIRIAKLESVVTKVEMSDEQPDVARLWLRVCFHEPEEYAALAFRRKITTRFELRYFGAEAPSAVQWFLDGKSLSSGEGAISVNFEPVADYSGPPEDVLAPYYTGGPGTLQYRAAGHVLDIWNDYANGVFFGEVKALFAYPGDPPLTESLDSGYDRAAGLGIWAIELRMDSGYRQHVEECTKILRDIDRKRIKVLVGKPSIDPGDPPPFREYMQERVTMVARFARAINLQVLARLDKEEHTSHQQGGRPLLSQKKSV